MIDHQIAIEEQTLVDIRQSKAMAEAFIELCQSHAWKRAAGAMQARLDADRHIMCHPTEVDPFKIGRTAGRIEILELLLNNQESAEKQRTSLIRKEREAEERLKKLKSFELRPNT